LTLAVELQMGRVWCVKIMRLPSTVSWLCLSTLVFLVQLYVHEIEVRLVAISRTPYPFNGTLFTMYASSSALFVWAVKFPVCCGPIFLRLVFVLQVLRLWPSPIWWDAWDSGLVGLPSLFRLEIYQWITMFSGFRVTTLLTVDKICQIAQSWSFPHRLSNCQPGMVAIFFLINW